MRTLYVIGAGASKEADMPCENFSERIAALCDHDASIYKAKYGFINEVNLLVDIYLHENMIDNPAERQDVINRFNNAKKFIRENIGFFASIDHLMKSHKDDKYVTLVGKMAIVHVIVDAETKSRMKDVSQMGNIWFNKLFKSLVSSFTKDEFIERIKNKVIFIVFNYDRCLEEFLYLAIKSAYRISDVNELNNIMYNIKIYHPYGKIGILDWQPILDTTEKICFEKANFGEGIDTNKIIKQIRGIKTFHDEEIKESEYLERMRMDIKDIERLKWTHSFRQLFLQSKWFSTGFKPLVTTV
jgi:hypothetical protein